MHKHDTTIKTLLIQVVYVFTLCCLMPTVASAAEGDIDFCRLTNRDGLSNSHINAIIRDSKGYVWFGTQAGLARYDGFRIKMFLNNNVNPNSLPNNSVDDIQQDAWGNLWIHTDRGYCIYQYEKEQFDRKPEKWLESILGFTAAIDKVFIDKEKNLWIVVYGHGCYFIDAKTLKPYLFPYPEKGKAASANTLDDVWITHFTDHHGSVVVSYGNGAISRIDGKRHRILWTNNALTAYKKNKDDAMYTYLDSKYNYWVLTEGKTYIYAMGQKKWICGAGEFLKSQGITSPISSSFLIRDMASTSDGRLWMATDHDGLIVVDYQRKTCRQYLKSEYKQNSLPDNSLQCVFIDKDDAVWLGAYKNGVAYFSPSFTRFSTIPLGDVCTITQDKNGNLWCGTNDAGILSYNPVTKQTVRYPSSVTGLQSDIVVSSVTMSDGTMYFGTFNGGMVRYRNGQWKTYTVATSELANNNVWCMIEDKQHRLMLGTLGGGFQVMNTQTDEMTTYDMGNSTLPSNFMGSFFRMRGDDVLLGHSQNFTIFNTRTHAMKNIIGTRAGNPFPSPSTNYAMMDSRGIIWMASPAGIIMYDTVSDQLLSVNELNGTQGSVGCSIEEDKNHDIWLISEFMITRVKLAKEDNGQWNLMLSSFNSLDGLQNGQFNYRSSCLLADGSIAVGGQDGINIIPVNAVSKTKKQAKVLFSGLVLFDHALTAGEEYEGRVVLDKSLDFCRELDLNNKDNAFTIQLASSDVTIPSRSRFLYRMAGVSDKWMLTPEGRPSVTFTNLAPGSYTLQVKVVNADGTESEDISELKIHVHPPFYFSKWAILIYFFLLVVLFFTYRKRMINKQRAKYERQKMEEDIRKTEELNELKLNFFTNVSHELRTPLTLVISPLNALIKKEHDEDKRHKMELIQRNAQRLLGLVNQILDFRKMEQKQGKLTLEKVDVVAFVQNICHTFQQLVNNHTRLEFHSSVPKLLMDFDVDKVGKIMNNLLSNAYKFTPDGGNIKVGLTIRSKEDDASLADDMLRISVADTGRGLSDADKKQVFDRFYQVNGTEMQPYGGSGIGLNLVMQFAKLHGGDVHVEDNPGGGAKFVVDIPVRHGEEVASAGPSMTDDTAASTSTMAPTTEDAAISAHTAESEHPVAAVTTEEKPLVLLVDDSDDFREFMHEMLEDSYQVVEAVNGQDAWDKMQKQAPDVILSDVMMPVMDGNALCRLVKDDARLRSIPFVMLTARLADEHRKEGYESGADAYITKPFDVDLLKVRIANFLKWNHSTGESAVGQVAHPDILPGADNSVGAVTDEQADDFKLSVADKKFLDSVDLYIRDNMGDPDTSVESMSAHLLISRVQLYKRVLALTGTTPSEYMRAKRIKRAEELLREGEYNISEIAYRVGFNNPRYFSKYFQEAYGMTPSQYKKKLSN